jgi:hypothetical protein
MKLSTQYKIYATITLSVSCLVAFAQGKEVASIQIDTLTKIIGGLFTVGGLFMGLMQLKMANKIAEVEAKFNISISKVKEEFALLLEKETDKLETKIQLSGKEIEARMATRHDIDNMKSVMKLQHELTTEQMKSLKEQLLTAARIYKKDNE